MPKKLCWLAKCCNLPKLNFILQNSCSYICSIHVSRKRDSWMGFEGSEWGGRCCVAHPHCLLYYRTHWWKAVARPAAIPPPPDLSSAPLLSGLVVCECWAPRGRALASARHLCHEGESQHKWTQVSVCPPGVSRDFQRLLLPCFILSSLAIYMAYRLQTFAPDMNSVPSQKLLNLFPQLHFVKSL